MVLVYAPMCTIFGISIKTMKTRSASNRGWMAEMRGELSTGTIVSYFKELGFNYSETKVLKILRSSLTPTSWHHYMNRSGNWKFEYYFNAYEVSNVLCNLYFKN